MLQTIEFDLPIGYTDKDGTVHKTITMCSMTGAHQLAVANDREVKELAKSGIDYNIDFGSLSADTSDGDILNISGSMDPVRMFISKTAVLQLNTILFTQVVLSLGTILKPARNIFRELQSIDYEKIVMEHAKLNQIDESSLAKAKAENKDDASPS